MRTDRITKTAMRREYERGGKFKDFVDLCMKSYGTDLDGELEKAITFEYYESVTKGVNKDKEVQNEKNKPDNTRAVNSCDTYG